MLSEAKFQDLYNRQRASGLNVKEFCSNEGISESIFYYRRKKLRKNDGARDFIPLVVKSSQSISPLGYAKSHPLVQGTGEMDDVLLELVYPNGTKLRIKKDLDLTHLRALISLYD